MTDVGRVFGRGIAFPPQIGEAGAVTWTEGAVNIRDAIRIILLTERGERVMLPEFGAGLKRYLFEPNTLATRRLIEEEITQAIKRWEPRVKLDTVTVDADRADPDAAIASIRYQLVANRASEELQLRLQLNAGT